MRKSLCLVLLAMIAMQGALSCTARAATWQFGGTPVISRSPGYNYGTSVIQDGNVQKFWWCGTGYVNGIGYTDTIYYYQVDLVTHATVGPMIVFMPSAGTGAFDSYYVSDPSVIMGQFTNPDNGVVYSYAMYYSGTYTSTGNDNRIGVAFSNDGTHWVRYSRPVIGAQGSATNTYGAGQPATYSMDGRGGIIVFYTDTTGGSNSVFYAKTTTGSSFATPHAIPKAGLPALYGNNDFVYNGATAEFYVAAPQPGRAGDRETYRFQLAKMNANALLAGTGTWTLLGPEMNTSVTGLYLNHSPGFLRDKYGNIINNTIETYFAGGTNDTSTWEIYWSILQ